jgi:hypothetical protein
MTPTQLFWILTIPNKLFTSIRLLDGIWPFPLGIGQLFVHYTFPNQGKMQPVLTRARDLSCSDSPGYEPRHREYGDPVIVGEHRGCRMGSLVAMRWRIGSHSDRRRTIERGFGLGLSVVVVALPIGWLRTVLWCEASSGVGTLAERFSLDRSGSQIEKFIDFESD